MIEKIRIRRFPILIFLTQNSSAQNIFRYLLHLLEDFILASKLYLKFSGKGIKPAACGPYVAHQLCFYGPSSSQKFVFNVAREPKRVAHPWSMMYSISVKIFILVLVLNFVKRIFKHYPTFYWPYQTQNLGLFSRNL